MPAPTLPAYNLLTDPGYLFWAPPASTLPTNTVVASVFTDAWPVAWIPLGLTDDGSDFTSSITVQPIMAAELFDPVTYRTTERTGSIAFMLKGFTATNLQRAFNGATLTVTGATTTTLTQIDPPAPGAETRAMIGWESLDSTVRLVCYQVINSGDVKLAFKKAPSNTSIPWNAQLEKPTATQPWRAFTAGAARG